jgi:CBS domain-containing protein
MMGEIGGTDEQDAARSSRRDDEAGRRLHRRADGAAGPPHGHAGAIISGSSGTAAEKIEAFETAGMGVAQAPDRLRRARARATQLAGARRARYAGPAAPRGRPSSHELSDFVTRTVSSCRSPATRCRGGRVLSSGSSPPAPCRSPSACARALPRSGPEDLVGDGRPRVPAPLPQRRVRELAVALGRRAAPVERELGESDETQSARIVLLVAAPPRHAALYLQVVGASRAALAARRSRRCSRSRRRGARRAAGVRRVELRDQLAVRDLMTERPRSVAPDTALRDAALDMVARGVAGLPVVEEDGRVVGMLSQRELLQHLLTKYLARGGAPAAQPPTRARARCAT